MAGRLIKSRSLSAIEEEEEFSRASGSDGGALSSTSLVEDIAKGRKSQGARRKSGDRSASRGSLTTPEDLSNSSATPTPESPVTTPYKRLTPPAGLHRSKSSTMDSSSGDSYRDISSDRSPSVVRRNKEAELYSSSDHNMTYNSSSQEDSHPYDGILNVLSDSEHFLSEKELQKRVDLDPLVVELRLMKSSVEMREQILEVKRAHRELVFMNRAADILRSEELNGKLNSVELLLQGFESCVVESQHLQNALSKPFLGSNLKIEKKYHESVQKFLFGSADMLRRFQSVVDTLQWHKKFDLSGVSGSLRKISSAVQECEKTWSIIDKAFTLLREKSEEVLNDNEAL